VFLDPQNNPQNNTSGKAVEDYFSTGVGYNYARVDDKAFKQGYDFGKIAKQSGT
jgi:hypothetical protein